MKKKIVILFAALLGLAWVSNISSIITTPKNVQEHIKKAESYEADGIYVEALEEYEQALTYKENDPEISLKMAKAYLKKGDTSEFTYICENIANLNPDNEAAINTLIEYYVQNDEEDIAVRYLDDYLVNNPNNESARKWFVKLQGSYDEISCSYKYMSPIVNGSTVFREEELFGILNSYGDTVVSPIYKEAYPYSEGYALALRDDNKYVFLDEEGNVRKILDKEYSDIGMISGGRVVASKNKKFGLLYDDLEEATEFKWDNITNIKNKIGAACKNGKWALINKNGEEQTEYAYEDVIIDDYGFCSEQERIFVKKDKKYIMINKKAEQVGELSFDDAKAFNDEGYAAVCKSGKWGFVDVDGNLVIDYKYDDAESFSNGYGNICQSKVWNYIDVNNNIIMDKGFEEPSPMSKEGTVVVKYLGEKENYYLIQLNLYQ